MFKLGILFAGIIRNTICNTVGAKSLLGDHRNGASSAAPEGFRHLYAILLWCCIRIQIMLSYFSTLERKFSIVWGLNDLVPSLWWYLKHFVKTS